MIDKIRIVKFGHRVKELRTEAGLSVRALAERAEMSFSLLTGIENARRGAGRSTVERLGAALRLQGHDLALFILDGLVICKRDVVLEECLGYPAPVLNALPLALRGCGVLPEMVKECTLGGRQAAIERREGDGEGADLLVLLKDGKRLQVSFKFLSD